nr:MAG TPA: hypothetical protein [Caudoviricetes sp.]
MNIFIVLRVAKVFEDINTTIIRDLRRWRVIG